MLPGNLIIVLNYDVAQKYHVMAALPNVGACGL